MNNINNNEEIRSVDWCLRSSKYFTLEEANEYNAKGTTKGLIIWCDRINKKALIAVKEKNTLRKIFMDRNSISNTQLKNLRAGDTVQFFMKELDNKIYACNIHIVSHSRLSNKEFEINKEKNLYFSSKNVLRYGMENAFGSLMSKLNLSREELNKKLYDNHYSYQDLNYVYITTIYGSYNIFQDNSPINGDGKVQNLKEYLHNLDKYVLGINYINRNFISYEELQNKKQIKQEKAKESFHKNGYMTIVKGYIVELGFTRDEADKAVKQFNLDKKLKKGIILIEDDPKTLARIITERMKPHEVNNKDLTALRLKVKGNIKYLGYSDSKANKLMLKFKFEDKINDLLSDNTNPKVIAKVIVDKYGDNI